jgi:hypothetical protein
MRRAIARCLSLGILAATQLGARASSAQNDQSLEIFLTKFKTAVINRDKAGRGRYVTVSGRNAVWRARCSEQRPTSQTFSPGPQWGDERRQVFHLCPPRG